MTSELADIQLNSTTTEPRFSKDFLNVSIYLVVTIIIWTFFLLYYPFFLSWGIIGLVIAFVGFFLLIPYTFGLFNRLFEAFAYQNASRRTGVPYMNYKSKCPFLKRNFLTFSCVAEQIAPFEVAIFEKCHKKHMWEPCWPERLSSILEVFNNEDRYPPKVPDGFFTQLSYRGLSEEEKEAKKRTKYKQQLSLIIAAMKEHALPAATTMYNLLVNETEDIETRVTAGFALAEMKEERGVTPLISMLGQFHQRLDQTIKAVLLRYEEKALPSLIEAAKDCDTDMKCGRIIEIIVKIGPDDSVPILEDFLKNESSGEYTRLQALYALQEINSEESFKILIAHLETASEEEQEIIKQACLSREIVSFPLLIESLGDREISEDFYSLIGDILADVDADTYDSFFTKLIEVKGQETAQRLARILKEHTPEDDEEFQIVREVINKYSEDFKL
ncbi:MAG: HEAT repeat domain-containing protein [Candidatus Hermodarchaeota archaeon]